MCEDLGMDYPLLGDLPPKSDLRSMRYTNTLGYFPKFSHIITDNISLLLKHFQFQGAWSKGRMVYSRSSIGPLSGPSGALVLKVSRFTKPFFVL